MIDIKVLASSSKGNCYLVDDGSTQLLLECGISFKEIQRKLNFKTSSIAGCLISHEHGDHAKAVKDVIKAGIDIYTAKGTQEALGVTGHRLKTIASLEQFNIGTWTILPFEAKHDAAEPLGFLLMNQTGEKLLFATDTYYIKYRFKGLTHIMVEANYSLDILNENVSSGRILPEMKKRLLKSHLSLHNAKKFLKANDLSRVGVIYLIHLSDSNSDAEQFKREVAELTGKHTIVAKVD